MKRCLLVLVVAPIACTTPNAAPPLRDSGVDGRDAVAAGEAGPGRDGALDDRRNDGGAKPDGFSCTPNAFLGCKAGATVLQCNAAGNGTLLVDCSPYLCDATSKRCTQCDPKIPPTCQGGDLLTCTADGLLVKTICPSGCANGSCTGCTPKSFYKDGDGDGFGNAGSKLDACVQPVGHVANGLDCDDADPAAHPGQTAFFEAPSKGTGGFDFNCDKVEESETQSLVSCVVSGMNCVGDGWLTTVPTCGAVGVWAKCNKQGAGPTGCGMTTFTKTQRCR